MDNITQPTTKRGPGRPRTITALDVDCLQDHVVSDRTLQSVGDERGVSRETVRQHVAKFPETIRRNRLCAHEFVSFARRMGGFPLPYVTVSMWLNITDKPLPAPDAAGDDGA